MKETSRVGDPGFDSFRDLLLSDTRLDTLLHSVCTRVVAAVPGADMAGVTLLDETTRAPRTAACTDQRVFTVDEDQYRSDEGPSLDAIRTRRLVRAGLGDMAVRWPKFAAGAEPVGVQSYLSAPISLSPNTSDYGEQIGSLNVYGWTDHGFTDSDEMLVTVFVTAVESAVWNSRRSQDAQSELQGLREAMRTRATIEQAKGIVMAIRGIAADDAFEVLSLQSQNENVKVATLAQRIVESVLIGD